MRQSIVIFKMNTHFIINYDLEFKIGGLNYHLYSII